MSLVGTRPQHSFGAAAKLCAPLQPSAHQLFGPRGCCQLPNGDIWVADTGHHRLLRWSPQAGGYSAEADLCLGQPGPDSEAANRGGESGPCSFHMPVGLIAAGKSGLAVADSWNHRLLLWRQAPQSPDDPADLVLGQADFQQNQANRGAAQPDADTLFWPSALYSDGECLMVADTGNRRVLMWSQWPKLNGQAADGVLGQSDMRQRDQNAGTDLDAHGMVWPHAIARWQDRLFVADAGANRIMCWRTFAEASGQVCDLVLGQPDPSSRLHNRGHASPARDSLAMPYALAVWKDCLVVADTANSRLLFWDARNLPAQADALHGQADFVHAGDNRWQQACDDSLCWPYGLAVAGDSLLIADTGNNRVQSWSLPDLLHAR